ncbi:MAG TPA: glycerol-3-phosphate 1-O-acyltransferase [Candidatus Binatia bacterium]
MAESSAATAAPTTPTHDARQRLPNEPSWPASNGHRVVFLLDASSRLERRLLEDWIERHRPAGATYEVVDIPPSRRRRRRIDGRLESCVASEGDPLMAPLRVAWERKKVDGVRENPLRELLTVGDPRDPGPLRQHVILRRHPERCMIVAAEPAPLSALRERWRQAGGFDPTHTTGLADFVWRQATLALERAERRLRGARYKVPKLVHEDILARPAFRAGVARLARETGKSEATVEREARRYLREIAATHSPHVIDLTAHLIHLLYTQAYGEALHYDRERLRELYGLTQRYPVVFLPSHKSNLDHLVLQYALHENGHPPNHTAGGINMNFFPVGPLVRRSGVFFIRRTFKDNPVYKFVLRQYIDYLIEKRFSLEWYIEGGRSRSGKMLPPRLGLLAYVVDAYRRGKAEDVFLIPVSIAYDQIQDVGDYVAEQRGAAKQKESFGWFLKILRSLRRRFGDIHINFGEPLSLRAALGLPEPGTEPNPDEQSLALQKLAFEVAVRINRVTPITPTSLVTLALLGVGDRALTLAEVCDVLRDLLVYVCKRRLPMTEEHALDTPEDVRRALGALVESGVVACFDEGPEAVYVIGPDQHLTAAYYRNTIIHFFVNAAIVELSLLHAAERDVEDACAEFYEEALRLRDLLKFEFFFSEKDAFRAELAQELALHDPAWEQELAIGGAEVRGLLRKIQPLVAHRVLRPFLEAYQVVGDALTRLAPDAPFDEDEFLKDCLALGKQYQLQRRIRSAESVSRVLFQTALSLARNRDLVDSSGPDLAGRRAVFAEEIRGAIRRVDAIDAMDAARRAGFAD